MSQGSTLTSKKINSSPFRSLQRRSCPQGRLKFQLTREVEGGSKETSGCVVDLLSTGRRGGRLGGRPVEGWSPAGSGDQEEWRQGRRNCGTALHFHHWALQAGREAAALPPVGLLEAVKVVVNHVASRAVLPGFKSKPCHLPALCKLGKAVGLTVLLCKREIIIVPSS